MSKDDSSADDVVLMSWVDSDKIELHFEGTDDLKTVPELNISSSYRDFAPKTSGRAQTAKPIQPSTVRKDFRCKFCLKTFTLQNNLIRHRKIFHNSTQISNTGLNCSICGKTFSRSDSLNKHQGTCTKNNGRHESCWYKNCIATFYRKTSLIEHLKIKHNLETEETIELTFQNPADFKKWKDDMEEDTFSFFSKHTAGSAIVSFYYCQQDGSSRPHRKIGEEARKTGRRNNKGQIKKDKTCIAYIRVKTEQNGTLAVTYQPTHTHPLNPKDFRHHRLSTATENYIDKQLKLGISPSQIADSLTDSSYTCNERRKPVNLCKNTLINILPRINGKLWRRRQAQKSREVALKQQSLKLATMKATATSNIKRLLELVENGNIPEAVLTKIETATTDLLNVCQATEWPQHCFGMRET